MSISRLHVVVPVRSLSDGKRRLGAAVDAEDRAALVVGLLDQTLRAAAEIVPSDALVVVSADETVLAIARHRGAIAVAEHSLDDLNSALREGRAAARATDADALLYLPADLPLLTSASLRRVLDAADAALTAGANQPTVLIAPSDARDGTNALLLVPPDVIEPSFGVASLAAHLQAAADAGATVQLVDDAELGFDLDTPDDLERLDPARLVSILEAGAQLLDEVHAGTAA